MIELMLMIDSRWPRLIDGPSTGGVSSSDNQGLCGEAENPEPEYSIASVVQESRLRRGEGQGRRSDAEVLQEGAVDAFEREES